MPNIAAAERERVERMHAKLDLLTRAHYTDPEHRSLIVGRREYEIVYDGTVHREEVRPAGAPIAPVRRCACGCGLQVFFRMRYASQACAGRGIRGLSTVERVRHEVSTGSRT